MSSCPHLAPPSTDQTRYTWKCREDTAVYHWVSGRFDTYLLSSAIRMVQVDSDLTLTSAERVHCECGRAHHPVPCRFNAYKRGTATETIWISGFSVWYNQEKKLFYMWIISGFFTRFWQWTEYLLLLYKIFSQFSRHFIEQTNNLIDTFQISHCGMNEGNLLNDEN